MGNGFGVIVVRPMAEIEASDIHPRIDELHDLFIRSNGGADRTNDLCPHLHKYP